MSSKLQFLGFMACLMVGLAGAGFHEDVDIIWGDDRGKIINGGKHLALSLDNYSGSAFVSKKDYLFGRFDCQIKLVGGNSAGTVTTFYLSSQGEGHDEIDFEFLGNASGEPYTLHTNVYAQGKGEKEQQFRLWFDPTKAFHTYSIVWNPQQIIFLVDNSPIRIYKNNNGAGIPYPTNQPMRLHCSLWNADDWATQGGRVKTDWSLAPFVATFRYLNIKGNACDGPFCGSKTTDSLNDEAWKTQGLDAKGRNRLKYLQARLMVYNYCQDRKRFAQGIPRECKLPRFL